MYWNQSLSVYEQLATCTANISMSKMHWSSNLAVKQLILNNPMVAAHVAVVLAVVVSWAD